MKWTPYLFAEGVVCVLDDKKRKNLPTIKAVEKLQENHYWALLYLSEDEYGRIDNSLKSHFDGYSVPIDRL